jgi:methionyl-tRNA synthetase
MKDQIEFAEFLEIQQKLEIKIGHITSVEDVPKSNKLIKLTVDFGDETRTVVTNIKPHLNSEISILDKKMAFITNLKPVTMMGVESTAMIMPGEIEKGLLITIECQTGTKLL